MIQIQGIDRVDLTHRIDEVKQRIATIENKFGIGGDFQSTLEREIARQEKQIQPAQKVQATQKVSETQKMPGTAQPVNAAEIENAAKVAEALKIAENKNSPTEKNSVQNNSQTTASSYFNGKKNYLPGEEALPGNNSAVNPVENNSSAAISSETAKEIYDDSSDKDEEVTEELSEEILEGTTAEMLTSAAIRHGVDPKLVKAIAIAESDMNQDEISPVGAIGVMQLMPQTAESLGVNPYDEQENIEGGTMYLKQMLDKFDGNVSHAVAAYNAGPGAVQKYGGVPPYGETQAYVGRVMDMYVS